MKNLVVHLYVDTATTRLETLMKELESFHYTPFTPTEGIAKGWDAAVRTWDAKGWDAQTPAPNPSYISLHCKTVPASVIEALLDIGQCVITGKGDTGDSHISLHKKTYHQFNPNGIIFSTDGRAFDPSYQRIKLSSPRWLLRKYVSAQYAGGLIDKMVSRRDEEWVLFPPNTDEVAEGSLMVYTLPDEQDKELIIDEHGYLYQRNKKRAFKRGDTVVVTLQDAKFYGTYNSNQPEQSDCKEMAYVDLGKDSQHEYILVLMDRVAHAE